jgi:DNA invertase Pin-like site-specific DNA recombinase
MKYGYARVSTDGQSVAAQIHPRRSRENFSREISGAFTHRQQLRRAFDVLDEGDVPLVTRLDRLARPLLNTLALIAEKKAGYRGLGRAWANTMTAHGRLMFTILAGIGEFERQPLRARSEGRQGAKPRGMKLGREFKLASHQRKKALARRDRGETLRLFE